MRAIVQPGYGSVDDLELREVARPEAVDGEVLVRVHAASVHPDVWHVVTGYPRVLRLMGGGLRRPRQPIPGTDMAGVVESAGARFEPGDEVFGETITGHSWRNGGAFAEYVAVPEVLLARKPAGVSFEQAAAVPTSGLIALHNLRGVRLGRSVLVNGAAGGVGAFAVQLAKAEGATVTAVDSAAKLELLRSLGADRTLDHAVTDFTRTGERYDAIVDVIGNHSFAACRRALAANGTYVLIGHDVYGKAGRRTLGSLPRFLGLIARTPFSRQLPKLDFSTPDKQASMARLCELIEAGALTPHVDRAFPLEQTREAIGYLASGQARGKVVIQVR